MRAAALQSMYESTGPFATAYLEPTPPDANAEASLELRWRALAAELTEAGADSATVRAMTESALARRSGKQLESGAVLVARNGRVLFEDGLDSAPGSSAVGADRARWSALPELGPYVRSKVGARRQVVAIVDRSGADFMVRDVGRGSRESSQHRTDGQQHPLHKVRGGGWAHKRIHNTVEEVSERNASQVVDELGRLAARTRPSVIVLAGDVEARSRVYARIPSQLRALVTTTEHGGRAAGSGDGLSAVLDQAIAEAEERERAAVVDRFESYLGTGSAVSGTGDVLAALRHGAVETLLYKVNDREIGAVPDELERTVAIGPEPLQLGESDDEVGALLRDKADAEIEHDTLDSAVLRACVATNAEIEVVDDLDAELPDGLGALLRFAIPMTTTPGAKNAIP